MNKSKSKKNFKYVTTIVAIIIILILVIINIFSFKKIKNLKSNYVDETKIDGLFINSEIQNILVNGNVSIKNDKLTINDIVDVEFKIDNDVIKKQNSIFTGIDSEYVGYNELFKKLDYSNSNFSLKITYIVNNKRETEDLQLEKTRLLNKKDIPNDLNSISKDDDSKNTTYYDERTKKALALENKGFTWNGCCFLERTFDNGDTVTLRADGSVLYYVNKQKIVFEIMVCEFIVKRTCME